ncbi:MAG: sulfatase-like hydrolase/transferase [Kiritimatiellaceae bacterium]|nr:sulfatase-like hydrolase/transferase [Kiritimatiellaceae bacterium]
MAGVPAVLSASAQTVTQNHTAGTRPNILFILADDLGWGDPSCYGNLRFKTPSIDRLAKQGTLFTQFYQGGSVCSPSRATLLTGRWPSELGIHGHLALKEQKNADRGMPNFLSTQAETLPKLLQQAGYTTVHVGKWHLGRPPESGESLSVYGFGVAQWIDCISGTTNLWDLAERPRASRVLVDETISELNILKQAGSPFYCQLWLNDPHAALAPSEAQMKSFSKGVPPGFTSPFMVYAATVTEMDRQLGRLLNELDKLGLSQNTVVILTSDNGPEDITDAGASWSAAGSAGPLRGRKRSLYEGGTRVPFIVRWPQGGAPAGQVNTQTVVSGADLLPTICELANAAIPGKEQLLLRGQSVVPALKGDKTFLRTVPLMWEWRDAVYNRPLNGSPILAIRDGKWKLLMNPDSNRIELYDMESDPSEQSNLVANQPEIAVRLSKKVLAWQQTLPAGPLEKNAGKNDYPWPQEAP